MWPFSNTADLRADNALLTTEISKLREDRDKREREIAKDLEELDFLREKIKSYVEYNYDGETFAVYRVHRFDSIGTLQQAKSELTRLKFYISVLESEIGSDRVALVRDVCKKLRCLCKEDNNETETGIQ